MKIRTYYTQPSVTNISRQVTVSLLILLLLVLPGCSLLASSPEHTRKPSPLITAHPDDSTERTDATTETDDTDVTRLTETWMTEETGGPDVDLTPLAITSYEPVSLSLIDYDGGIFTMRVPPNWYIETTGEYETFGFRLYDPAVPARQIFFYGSMSPLMKSKNARAFWKQYINNAGFPQAALYSDAPVLSPATARQFFKIFNSFTSFARDYGIRHSFPTLGEFEVLESVDRRSPMASAALDEAILRANFIQDKTFCEGLFATTVVDYLQYPVNNLDAGHYKAYVTIGISASAEEFFQLESVLAESIGSFAFTQAYIDQGVRQNQWETEVALSVGRTLAAAADSYNQAWWGRQKVNDTLSQKRSDATLGYDRVYDTRTGETYKAELGFIDEYEKDPYTFDNPNLQRVPDNGYDLYNQSISGYIDWP